MHGAILAPPNLISSLDRYSSSESVMRLVGDDGEVVGRVDVWTALAA
jgi:hypothetical protein